MANSYILTDNNEGKILPRLQTLTWIRSDDEVSDMQAFDNRQLSEEEYSNYKLLTANQMFNTADPILIQIITDYTTKNVILVNEGTLEETDLTGAVANKSTAWSEITSWVSSDYGTLTVYNKTIYTGLLGGTYHMRLELEESEGGLEYTSNTFVVGDYSSYPLIAWTHSVTGTRKGIYFSGVETFYTRIDGRYCEFTPGIDLELNDSWNKSLNLIDADSKFYAVMELNKLPRYFLEKLNCILQVDTKYINEELYEVESGIESQVLRDELIITSLYKGKLVWRKKDYEKYRDFEAEEEVEIPYILVNSDDEDYLTYNDDGDYLIYTDE